MTSTTNTSTTTTDAPCPWWCERPAGHGWEDDVIGESAVERGHEHLVGKVGHRLRSIAVDVSGCERAVLYPNGQVGDVIGFVEPPAVNLYGDHPEPMTAGEARELATVLLAAADLLDRVVAGR